MDSMANPAISPMPKKPYIQRRERDRKKNGGHNSIGKDEYYQLSLFNASSAKTNASLLYKISRTASLPNPWIDSLRPIHASDPFRQQHCIATTQTASSLLRQHILQEFAAPGNRKLSAHRIDTCWSFIHGYSHNNVPMN